MRWRSDCPSFFITRRYKCILDVFDNKFHLVDVRYLMTSSDNTQNERDHNSWSTSDRKVVDPSFFIARRDKSILDVFDKKIHSDYVKYLMTLSDNTQKGSGHNSWSTSDRKVVDLSFFITRRNKSILDVFDKKCSFRLRQIFDDVIR